MIERGPAGSRTTVLRILARVLKHHKFARPPRIPSPLLPGPGRGRVVHTAERAVVVDLGPGHDRDGALAGVDDSRTCPVGRVNAPAGRLGLPSLSELPAAVLVTADHLAATAALLGSSSEPCRSAQTGRRLRA